MMMMMMMTNPKWPMINFAIRRTLTQVNTSEVQQWRRRGGGNALSPNSYLGTPEAVFFPHNNLLDELLFIHDFADKLQIHTRRSDCFEPTPSYNMRRSAFELLVLRQFLVQVTIYTLTSKMGQNFNLLVQFVWKLQMFLIFVFIIYIFHWWTFYVNFQQLFVSIFSYYI